MKTKIDDGFDILYEDQFFKIIDKKTGILSEEVEEYYKNCLLVHRLDKPTSGVLVLAKSSEVKNAMKKLFQEKKVRKTYLAIADGFFEDGGKKIEKRFSFLRKSKNSQGKILWKETQGNGLEALTVFEVIKREKNYTALKCFPITGRTHQIRVHLKALGHPILGDYQYSGDFIYPAFVPRLMLHSFRIEFTHPVIGVRLDVKAPVPKEFSGFLKNSRV